MHLWRYNMKSSRNIIPVLIAISALVLAVGVLTNHIAFDVAFAIIAAATLTAFGVFDYSDTRPADRLST